MNLRRITLVSLTTIALLAIIAYSASDRIALALVGRMADRRFAERPLDTLVDGLHVGLCGAGSPIPDPRRGAPCTLIIAGKRMFLIDAGSAAAGGINRLEFNPGDLEALFLSHFHSDHIDGLGELMLQRWVASAHKTPLPIYGPTGVETVVQGLMQVYAMDRGYRVAHHGEATVPPGGFGGEAHSFQIMGGQFGSTTLIDEPDLQVVAFSVEHSPIHPAVGFRIRYKDRSVVVSGDTSKSIAVQREAKGVDLLVHEALAPELVAQISASARKAGRDNMAKVFSDIPGYHTSPEQVAEIARDAGVGAVLLNHIVPAVPSLPGFEKAFLGKARGIYGGRIDVGLDGDFVSLPAASKRIEFGHRP